MNAKKQIPAVFAIAVIFLASCAFGARKLSAGLLRDGHVTDLVQGRVISDVNGLWYFKLAEDVNDMASIVKAGTKIQLLPSRTLEQLAGDFARRDQNTYLLKARVTRYKGKNYIFPVFFRSVIVLAEQPQEEPITTPEPNEPTGKPEEDKAAPEKDEPNAPVEDANNLLEIPQEVA